MGEKEKKIKDIIGNGKNNTLEETELKSSLLSDLYSNEHIAAVYNLAVVIVITLFIDNFFTNWLIENKINFGFELIKDQFKNIHLISLAWLSIYFQFCMVFVAFRVWVRFRLQLFPKSFLTKTWDYMWIGTLISYYIFSFLYCGILKYKFCFKPAESLFILIEQPRLLMKAHSFIRHSVSKVLRYKHHNDEQLELPTFSHYVYYSFAPTLIFKEKYPRTKQINWKHVTTCLIEFSMIVVFNGLIFEKLIFPYIEDFGLRKYRVAELILTVIKSSTAGAFFLLSQFYLVLHVVQNLFAELLRFGDREFYKSWWLCTSYAEYYKTWNVIVHNWLALYIYKDFKAKILNNTLLAKLTVFFVSAVVHEWVLTLALDFHMPLLFIEFFGFGVLLTVFNPPKCAFYNTLFLYGIFLGAGMMMCLYGVEFFARKNIPVENATMENYLKPRFLTCDCFV